MNSIKALLINFFVLTNIVCFAQLNNFKQWTIKDGFAQSDIYSITQDNRGYIWISNAGGISSFDGKNFKSYNTKDGLVSNVARAVFVDSKNRIWIGTDAGISIYDGKKFTNLTKKNGLVGSTVLTFIEMNKEIWAGTDDGGINRITEKSENNFNIDVINEEDGLSSKTIFDLLLTKDNAVWAATYGGGINIIKSKNNTYDIKIISGSNKIPSDNIFCLSNDNSGNIWCGTSDAGAFRLNQKEVESEIFKPYILNTGNALNANTIWTILVTKANEVWLGSTQDGVNRISFDNATITNTSITLKEGLSGNQILSLYEDRDQHVWIGTGGDGLNMLQGDYFSHYSTKEGLPNNKILSIAQASDKSLWLAAVDGGLVNVSNNNNKTTFKTYTESNGLTSNYITTVACGNSRNENIWAGTSDKGLIKFDGKKFTNYTEDDGLISNRIYYLFVDSKGIVWCGTANGISRYDGTKFLNLSTDQLMMQNEGVKAIIEDKNDNRWFATAGGLARYSGDGSLRTFDEKEGLKYKDVNAIVSDKKGNIWIGTNGGGLYKFNVAKNDTVAIEFICNEEFLSAPSVCSMLFENDSTLIIGTYKGFDKLLLDKNGKIKSSRNYNSTDGFKGLECNDNSLIKDAEGNIWFGTVNGLTKYSPKLELKKNLAPELHITGLQLFFKDVDWSTKSKELLSWSNLPKELTLSYDENHLTFNFAAISFSNPEKVKYKYILEGRDKEWSPAKNATEVTFSGLSAGTYTFKVMAENELGVWSGSQSFSFTITPPWYKTTWFYITCVVVILLSFFIFVKVREKKLVKEKEVLEKIVEERTQEVREQKEHLAEKNKEITDSINYAKGIQHSMLPPMEDIKHAWKDLFLFFQPKDIVSGDFYWFQAINEHEFLIACADCTGHGVPGGFMSMVCSDKLHEAAKETKEPAQILNRTNNGVKTLLRQQIQVEGKSKDGMEICLLKVNTRTRQVSYSGANRLLWIVNAQTKELTEIKPTKASIASFTEFDFEYQQQEFTLNEGDMLYTTSDGYPDQFGGVDGKKYMSKKMKAFILDNCHLPMNEQHKIFDNDINKWMEGYEQVDDLLVIGIRL